jgi:uncharacterized protein YdbL (DUF1318 family)
MHFAQYLQRTLGAVTLALIMAMPAFALDLDAAKATGLVGETNTGYLAAVQPSSEVNALVASINSQRKAHYQEIATQNGITLQAVEVRAGQKAIEKTPAGGFINTGSGWQKK